MTRPKANRAHQLDQPSKSTTAPETEPATGEAAGIEAVTEGCAPWSAQEIEIPAIARFLNGVSIRWGALQSQFRKLSTGNDML